MTLINVIDSVERFGAGVLFMSDSLNFRSPLRSYESYAHFQFNHVVFFPMREGVVYHAHEGQGPGEALLGLPPVGRASAAAPQLPGQQLCRRLPHQLHQHASQDLLRPILPRYVLVQACCLSEQKRQYSIMLESSAGQPCMNSPASYMLEVAMKGAKAYYASAIHDFHMKISNGKTRTSTQQKLLQPLLSLHVFV